MRRLSAKLTAATHHPQNHPALVSFPIGKSDHGRQRGGMPEISDLSKLRAS